MTIGDVQVFAIESRITQAYEQLSLKALGFFVLYLGGVRYGVYEPDASMLANSFDQVCDRIARKGSHKAPFATEASAGMIADAFRSAVYGMEPRDVFFGIGLSDFQQLIYSNRLLWAPDGDEAFDDGSYVLQFDVGDRVRLIGFKTLEDGSHDPATLGDAWMDADTYYGVLTQWRDAFENEWSSFPKSDS